MSALQTASLVLVPQISAAGDSQMWERHAGTFRVLDSLPFAGQVAGAVERGRGRLVLEMFDGPGAVFAERQLVSGLADETCQPGDDADGDGTSGCADPDCWATCWPACPLATSCP